MSERDGWADAEYWKARAERAEALADEILGSFKNERTRAERAEALADQLAELLKRTNKWWEGDGRTLAVLAAWEEARRES